MNGVATGEAGICSRVGEFGLRRARTRVEERDIQPRGLSVLVGGRVGNRVAGRGNGLGNSWWNVLDLPFDFKGESYSNVVVLLKFCKLLDKPGRGWRNV